MQDVLARARTELRYEPIERRVRARLGPDTVVDSTKAVLLWEPRRVQPTYAVPRDDIDADVATATANNDHEDDAPRVLHPGIPFAVHTTRGEPLTIAGREAAGFRLDDDDLAGYVALDFRAFDAWLEEDEPVAGHPRGWRRDDLAWSYEQPLPDAAAIAGLVAFWDEQVDVFVDARRRPRPGGPVADALRHEFGV